MLLVLLTTHPHLLEGAERAQDGAAHPWTELPLCGVDDLHFHILRGDLGDLALQTLDETLVAGVAASQDYVLEEVSSDVNICLSNRLNHHVLHASEAFTLIILNEHLFSDSHSLAANITLSAIRQLKLLLSDCLSSTKSFKGLLSHIQQFLFQVFHNLLLAPCVVSGVHIRALNLFSLKHLLTLNVLKFALEGKPWFDFCLLVSSEPFSKALRNVCSSDIVFQNTLLQRVAIVHRCSNS